MHACMHASVICSAYGEEGGEQHTPPLHVQSPMVRSFTTSLFLLFLGRSHTCNQPVPCLPSDPGPQKQMMLQCMAQASVSLSVQFRPSPPHIPVHQYPHAPRLLRPPHVPDLSHNAHTAAADGRWLAALHTTPHHSFNPCVVDRHDSRCQALPNLLSAPLAPAPPAFARALTRTPAISFSPPPPPTPPNHPPNLLHSQKDGKQHWSSSSRPMPGS